MQESGREVSFQITGTIPALYHFHSPGARQPNAVILSIKVHPARSQPVVFSRESSHPSSDSPALVPSNAPPHRLQLLPPGAFSSHLPAFTTFR